MGTEIKRSYVRALDARNSICKNPPLSWYAHSIDCLINTTIETYTSPPPCSDLNNKLQHIHIPYLLCNPTVYQTSAGVNNTIQFIPRNMHMVFALLCFVVVIHWLIFPYPSGLLHWHCGNLTIAPVPAKQPWRIWINTSCEFIMNYCITTSKQSTTNPCAYFLGYTVGNSRYRVIRTFTLHSNQLSEGDISIFRCGAQLLLQNIKLLALLEITRICANTLFMFV